MMHAYCQCSQSGVDDVEAVVEVWQLVEQQPGPGAGQGAGRARDNVVPAPPTGLGQHGGGGVHTPYTPGAIPSSSSYSVLGRSHLS